ncbi:MAG: hypothetical protein PUE39_03465 [bacterium]|nr:hypothetical protein [bacterium]
MPSLIQNPRRHDITFHANGKIDISAHIARKLSLRPGDVIDVVVDENGEWLLCVKFRSGCYSGRYEGTVYSTTKKYRSGTFRTWCRSLCEKALTAAGQVNRLRCPCGEIIERDNKLYITIIYRCSL